MGSIFSSMDEGVTSESFSSAESQQSEPSHTRQRSISTPQNGSTHDKLDSLAPKKRAIIYSSSTESPAIGDEDKMIPDVKMNAMNERSLSMQLFHSFQVVMATQESMWDELKDWLRNKPDMLRDLGWDSDGDKEEPKIRRKFEALLDRYQE